jgi:hypothetical protein
MNKIVAELELWLEVSVDGGSVLDDPTGHEPWLQRRRSDIEWRFWDRYERYLEEEKGFARNTVRRLGELTDEVLSRLEDPQRPGKWDRRGVVAGQVQSGKTANYIGLIAKAMDAGYKLIVVLAGVHNSLRSQTQLRVDEGLVGYDSQRRRLSSSDDVFIGVGQLGGTRNVLHTLTTSAENGDFNLTVAKQANVDIGGHDPVILVVKKNASVLRNLITWATLIRQRREPDSDRQVVHGVPLLLIDDEADHASVNTAEDDAEPTMINRRIRELLAAFERTAYVGYTATPFANILIDHEANHTALDDDLFPRSFILTLPSPSHYIGPTRVFGLSSDEGTEPVTPLPLTRLVLDNEDWLPTGHRKEVIVGPLPESLRTAIRAFILSAAVRRARGQLDQHNSMLVHVTRFVAVQERVAELVRDEVDFLRRRLRYGDGSAAVSAVDELREIWRNDFEPTFGAVDAQLNDPSATRVEWSDVEPHLHEAAARIEVRTINGTARDALDYVERRDGMTVIAVGGDKLSRGLTLEGLTVSYFLRASKMYDTLMQMGRWFGYRPGYGDVTRLYLTPDLETWYAQIASSADELYRLFDHMVAAGGTPRDFGLRIRSSPDGLTVTSPSKMRRGKSLRLSFSGSISETVAFYRDDRHLSANLDAARALVGSLGKPDRSRRETQVWSNVDAGRVVDFLSTYETHPAAVKAIGPNLARYITDRVRDGELTKWTVAVISSSGRPSIDVLGLPVVPVIRAELGKFSDRYSIRRLLSPVDESIDLDRDEFSEALRRTIVEAEASGRTISDIRIPSGVQMRLVRSPKRGLLLLYLLSEEGADPPLTRPAIGFAVSFPDSPLATPIEYTVNTVYLQEEFGWE